MIPMISNGGGYGGGGGGVRADGLHRMQMSGQQTHPSPVPMLAKRSSGSPHSSEAAGDNSKRTNSLGRAADDCFACQKLRHVDPTVHCDRQRPRCNVCTSLGKVCSGYRQEFQWQGGAQRQSWTSGAKAKQAADAAAANGTNNKTSSSKGKKPAQNGKSQSQQNGYTRRPSMPLHPATNFQFVQETFPEYIDCTFGHPSERSPSGPSTGPAHPASQIGSPIAYGSIPPNKKRRVVSTGAVPPGPPQYTPDGTQPDLAYQQYGLDSPVERTPSRSHLTSILNDDEQDAHGQRSMPAGRNYRPDFPGLHVQTHRHPSTFDVDPGLSSGAPSGTPEIRYQPPAMPLTGNYLNTPTSAPQAWANQADPAPFMPPHRQATSPYSQRLKNSYSNLPQHLPDVSQPNADFARPHVQGQHGQLPYRRSESARSASILQDGHSPNPAGSGSATMHGSGSHEVMSHAPPVDYEGTFVPFGSSAAHSTKSGESPAGSGRGNESEQPDVRRNCWHDVVGSPAAMSYLSPGPTHAVFNPSVSNVKPVEHTNDVDIKLENSMQEVTDTDALMDIGVHDADPDDYDELLPRPDDDDADSGFLATDGSMVSRKNFLIQGLLMTPPSWHDMSMYELQRIQHFDRFICPVPVTFNARTVINPYREVMPFVHHFPALKQAVLAAGIQHNSADIIYDNDESMQKSSALAVSQHKAQSLGLFREALQNSALCRTSDGMLLTAFILVLLGATQTAMSNWSVHFQGIARLLDARGGVEHLLRNTVLQSQLAMLVWYDCSISLVGRKPPCIPSRYMEALVSIDSPGWSFFALTGCISGLVRIVYRFCEIAANHGYEDTPEGQREIETLEQEILDFDQVAHVEDVLDAKELNERMRAASSSPRHDSVPISTPAAAAAATPKLSARQRVPRQSSRIEEVDQHDNFNPSLPRDNSGAGSSTTGKSKGKGPSQSTGATKAEPFKSCITDAQIDEAHDRMHGAEVWKNALLLYSSRVFHRLDGNHPRLRSLARRVVDHARLIEPSPRTGVSKQLLLPLMLAGAEEKGVAQRRFIEDFVEFWHADTRFGVWKDAIGVMRDLWKRQAEEPEKDWCLMSVLADRDEGYMFG